MTPATVKISEHEDRAALTESAFAAIKCGGVEFRYIQGMGISKAS